MIIFSSVYPSEDIINLIRDNGSICRIYNFSSIYQINDRLNLLYFPYNYNEIYNSIEYGEYLKYQYDLEYHNLLLNDCNYFIELFNKVINPHYHNEFIFVLVNDIDDLTAESLSMFINMRWGIHCKMCREIDDIYGLDLGLSDDHNIDKIDIFDFDRDRFTKFYMEGNLIICPL